MGTSNPAGAARLASGVRCARREQGHALNSPSSEGDFGNGFGAGFARKVFNALDGVPRRTFALPGVSISAEKPGKGVMGTEGYES